MKNSQNNSPHLGCHSSSAASESKFWLPLGVMGTLISGAIVLFPLTVQAASLTQWHYDPTTNRLEVTVDQGTTPRYFLMAQPARIVLDLPDTAVGAVKSQATYSGAVRKIRVSQFQPGLTRIVMELSPDVELAPGQVKLEKANYSTETSRWVLHPLIAQASPIQPSGKIPASAPTPAVVSEPPPPTQSVAPLPSNEHSHPLPSAPFPVESPAPVRVPPLSSEPVPATGNRLQPETSVPAQVVKAEKILPPPTPIPIGSDEGLEDPDASQSSQTPPPASKTPLPPSSSPAELAIDTRNAIKISVPPPLSGIPIAPPPSSSAITGKPLAPAAVTPPVTPSSSTIAAKPLAPAAATPPVTNSLPAKPSAIVASPPIMDSFATEMPSTVQVLPNTASTISVPPLSNPQSGSVSSGNATPSQTAVAQATTPLPPQVQLPPLTPLLGAPAPQSATLPAPMMQGGIPPTSIGIPVPAASTLPGADGLPTSSIPSLPANQTPLVTVPPLAPNASQAVPPRQAPVVSRPSPTIAPPASAPSVPLQSTPTFSPPEGSASQPKAKPSTVEFGQPLPATGAIALSTFPRGVPTYPAAPSQPAQPATIQPASVQQAFFQSPNPSVLLPLGATLNLVYPGTTSLKLPAGPPLQEVLLLQTEVRDAAGNVIFPQGTYVLGRFDTNDSGSKFIAQAIAVGEKTIPLAAESNPLSNNRELSTTSMAIGFGVGALLGGVVSSFSGLGLVGGAAAGAATSFLASPKQVTLQPGQVIQVQVKRDLVIQ